MTSNTIAFMHIPKTSGSSVTHALRATVQPSLTVQGYDRSLFGDFNDFYSFDAGLLNQVYLSPADLPKKIELVAGHFAYSTLRSAYPSANLLTTLREPVSRLMSLWLYLRQQTDLTLKASGAWADRMRYGRLPLERFLDEPLLACNTDNVALRLLLWPHPLVPGDHFIALDNDEQLLSEALDRLNDFDFVDIVENDRLAWNLRQWLGRESFSYERLNETANIPLEFRSPLYRELTLDALLLLGARSRLDLKLWASVAIKRLPSCDISTLRERTVLVNTAKFAALMASPSA